MDDLDYLSQNLEQFKKQYAEFSECIPKLLKAYSIALDVPNLTSESDSLVLVLSKLSFDRFEDILILCSQGRGDGAMPLLRAMFEGLVNASYIQANPEKAEDFRNYLFSFVLKVRGHMKRLNAKELDAEETKFIEDALKLYAGIDGEIPKPKNDWAPVNFVDRATAVNLGEYVVPAYYIAMETAHSSMIHVYSQSKSKDGQRFIFGGAEEFSQRKVKEALTVSHKLAIEIVALLHKTFGNDDLESYIEQCHADYSSFWSKSWSDNDHAV